jgi:hypothetical protein
MAGSFGQGASASTSHLRVAGQDLFKEQVTPLDLEPIRWRDEAGAVGELTFAVEDTAANRTLPGGSDIRLEVDGTTVFGGTLLRRRFERAPAGRIIRCSAVSYDSWLDWRIVPRWSSLIDTGKRVRRMNSDRTMVLDLIERRAGPLRATSATVSQTNTQMDIIRTAGEHTVRDVLDIIADEAREDGGSVRRYHVDDMLRVHWYQFPEGPVAPFRLADGSYVADVTSTTGLLEFWSLREEGGSTSYGSEGVANLTRSGTWTTSTDVGDVNDRAYRAAVFDGTTTSASTTITTPGDTFSLEFWIKRTATGVAYDLLHANATNDFRVSFGADDKMSLVKHGGASSFTSVDTFDTDWHHVIIAHDSSSTAVYVDGSTISGTGTNQTFTGGSRTFTVGTAFSGSLQHLGIYSTKLGGATVLARYRQGVSIAPEDLWLEDDWGDAVHAAYVRGKNNAGSGMVQGEGGFQLGRVQDYVTRERADTVRERNRAGLAYTRRHGTVRTGGFRTREAGAWRAGQVAYVTDDALGLDATGMLVAAVSGTLADTGLEYEIDLGGVRRRLLRQMNRRKRR